MSKDLVECCVQYSTVVLQCYSEPVDWQRVRFSNKVYFSLGLEGAIRIIQKSRQRYLYSGIALTRKKRHKKTSL